LAKSNTHTPIVDYSAAPYNPHFIASAVTIDGRVFATWTDVTGRIIFGEPTNPTGPTHLLSDADARVFMKLMDETSQILRLMAAAL